MKRSLDLPGFLMIFLMVVMVSPANAGLMEDLMKKGAGMGQPSGPGNDQIVAGLKEALSIGTGNAVSATSKTDGYFGNQAIKILVPEKIRKVGDVLGKVGYQKEVDDFVLSMNRAAEKAAPQAKAIFIDAVHQMTVEDARKILDGGDTAATEYFKSKTSGKLHEAFQPIVSSSMSEVGTTRSYKEMMDKYKTVPFAGSESLDLDRYVTDKSLDGLFHLVAQEEIKIRKDPAARVTDLLKTVFGGK
jgi:RNA binding exosome subunit